MIRHLSISIIIITLLAGCAARPKQAADEAPESEDKSPPQVPTGNWEGLVQEGYSSYPIGLTFENCAEGSDCGQLDYPTFGCGGVFRFNGVEGSELNFTEIIEYGEDQCLSGSTITAKYGDDQDTLILGWIGDDGSPGPTAVIRKVAELSAQTPVSATAPAPTSPPWASLQGSWRANHGCSCPGWPSR